MSTSKPLKQIAVIDLPSIGKFDVAKNDVYHLVDTSNTDAYGNTIAMKVDLSLIDHSTLLTYTQALLNALGDHMSRLQHQREARLGDSRGGDSNV